MSSGESQPARPDGNWRAIKPQIYMPLATGSAPQQLPRKLRCDVILFVAVATEEKQLKAVAKELGLAFEKCQGGHFDYFDLGQVGTFRVLAVRTEMGPFSHDGSAARALLAKAETGATALVSVGMGSAWIALLRSREISWSPSHYLPTTNAACIRGFGQAR